MIAGIAVAAIGVPLCVLPGPGVAVIACGVALASKGQRTYSGRKPTKVERKLDVAAEKLGSAAKKEAGKIAKTAAREAPVVAEKAPELRAKELRRQLRQEASLRLPAARRSEMRSRASVASGMQELRPAAKRQRTHRAWLCEVLLSQCAR